MCREITKRLNKEKAKNANKMLLPMYQREEKTRQVSVIRICNNVPQPKTKHDQTSQAGIGALHLQIFLQQLVAHVRRRREGEGERRVVRVIDNDVGASS